VTDCCEHDDETSVSINVLCYCNSNGVCPVTATVIVYVQLLQQLLCMSSYCNSYCVYPVTVTVIVYVL